MRTLRERLALLIAPWLKQQGATSWVIFDHPAQTIYTTSNTAAWKDTA